MAEIQAKVIVLGDSKTGKTELIRNLGFNARLHGQEDARADVFFSVAEFPASELQNSDSSVFLKVWEPSVGMNKREEQLAFKGSLICIITVDIRDEVSANNAFNKWLSLKESFMAEAFLFIVGTFLDQSLQRRVEVDRICKACAQKDAVYVEMSNTTGYNVSLLNNLIAQRLNYMIHLRNVLGSQPIGNSAVPDAAGGAFHSADDGSTEAKFDATDAGMSADGGEVLDPSILSFASMEQHMLTDSVGSVLSSYLGIDSWPGFEQQEAELAAVGGRIDDFVEMLVSEEGRTAMLAEGNGLGTGPLLSGGGNDRKGDSVGLSGSNGTTGASIQSGARSTTYVDAGYSLQALEDAYNIMGLALPEYAQEMLRNESSDASAAAEEAAAAASAEQGMQVAQSSSPTRAAAPYLRKMVVRMLDGSVTDAILDLEGNTDQQIDLFLLSHSLGENMEAKQKLTSFVENLRQEYEEHGRGRRSSTAAGTFSSSSVTSPPPPPPPAPFAASSNSMETPNTMPPPPPPLHKAGVGSAGGADQPSVGGIAVSATPTTTTPAPPPLPPPPPGALSGGGNVGALASSQRTFKLRLSLPSGSLTHTGDACVVAIVHKGDLLADVRDTLIKQHGLSADCSQSLMVQLSAAAGIEAGSI